MPYSPVIDDLQAISDGSTNFDVISEYRKIGELFCCQAVCVANLTSAGKLAQIGIKRAEKNIWLKTIVMTDDDYFYTFDTTFYMPITHRIIVRFINTNDGDVLRVNIFGYQR